MLVALVACGNKGSSGKLAMPDRAEFETQAYPVLLRDCGFVECHGKDGRFLQIVGPGRTRLSADAGLFEPLPEEIDTTYRSVSAVIDVDDPENSDLLRKPLSPKVGGSGHKGVDSYGRDVYATTSDPDYEALHSFVLGVAADLPQWDADWEQSP